MLGARESLKGTWLLAIGAFVIYQFAIAIFTRVFLFSAVSALGANVGAMVSTVITHVITGPIMVGVVYFYMRISRGEDASMPDLLNGFRKFSRNMFAYLMMLVATMVGFMLLIVPGVILALMFSQTLFILADDQAISAVDAIKKSVKMMDGNKRKLLGLLSQFLAMILLPLAAIFILVSVAGITKATGFNFTGLSAMSIILVIVAALAFIAGLFWIYPYMMVSLGKFYDDIKNIDGVASVVTTPTQTTSQNPEPVPVATPIAS